MLTVKQIYENAGMLMRFDRSYEKVRENIETLVMKKKLYKWDGEATKEFIDTIFLIGKVKEADNET